MLPEPHAEDMFGVDITEAIPGAGWIDGAATIERCPPERPPTIAQPDQVLRHVRRGSNALPPILAKTVVCASADVLEFFDICVCFGGGEGKKASCCSFHDRRKAVANSDAIHSQRSQFTAIFDENVDDLRDDSVHLVFVC